MSVCGIEALVVGYVCGLEEGREVTRWAAFALLRASLGESSAGGSSGMVKMRPFWRKVLLGTLILQPAESGTIARV